MTADEESRKRLYMRACRRGFLEVELVMRSFLDREMYTMDEAQLAELERLVEMEDLDLWEVLTGRREPPQGVSPELVAKLRGSRHPAKG